MHSILQRTAAAAVALALLTGGLAACSSNDDSRRRMADRDANSEVVYDSNGQAITRSELNSRRGDWYSNSAPETTEEHRQRMERLAEDQRQAEVRKIEKQTQSADPGQNREP